MNAHPHVMEPWDEPAVLDRTELSDERLSVSGQARSTTAEAVIDRAAGRLFRLDQDAPVREVDRERFGLAESFPGAQPHERPDQAVGQATIVRRERMIRRAVSLPYALELTHGNVCTDFPAQACGRQPLDEFVEAIMRAGKRCRLLRPTEPEPQKQLPFQATVSDAPFCAECGSLMTVNGSCYKCENCGSTSGCS